MRTMIRFAFLFVLASALPFGGAEAANEYDWGVSENMKAAVEKFNKTSDVVSDLRDYGVANDHVYVKETDHETLMRIYDFLACIQLTNPDADIEVDSGGGFDISIDSIAFANGNWPVDIRISVVNTIVKMEKYAVSILEKITVGSLVFTDVDRMTNSVQLMTAKCRGDGS